MCFESCDTANRLLKDSRSRAYQKRKDLVQIGMILHEENIEKDS